MTDSEAIQSQITKLRELKRRKDLVLQLENDPAFKELILDGYCEKECARFTHGSVDPSLTESQRADSLRQAQSGGLLMQFLSVTAKMGHQAEHQIAEAELELENALREEA